MLQPFGRKTWVWALIDPEGEPAPADEPDGVASIGPPMRPLVPKAPAPGPSQRINLLVRALWNANADEPDRYGYYTYLLFRGHPDSSREHRLEALRAVLQLFHNVAEAYDYDRAAWLVSRLASANKRIPRVALVGQPTALSGGVHPEVHIVSLCGDASDVAKKLHEFEDGLKAPSPSQAQAVLARLRPILAALGEFVSIGSDQVRPNSDRYCCA